MRSFLVVITVLALALVGSAAGFFGGQTHPVYAFSSGCDALNSNHPETGLVAVISGPLHFDEGEVIFYQVIGTWPNAPTSTTVWITDAVSATVAQATAAGNLASVSYTVPAAGVYNFRFDWSFATTPPYTPHSVIMNIFCGFRDTIPTGFVLHTITCDTPVYDTPGGSPVGDNKVTNGQTWYTNPTAAKAANGSLWTEIFVSGSSTAFVPANCVN